MSYFYLFIYLSFDGTCVLPQSQEYFIDTTAGNIMVGGNSSLWGKSTNICSLLEVLPTYTVREEASMNWI